MMNLKYQPDIIQLAFIPSFISLTAEECDVSNSSINDCDLILLTIDCI